ncbi:DUF3833 domain-containing protein [Rheinheimera sp.]|uniref:DUF3833 domain-containing protein n=1 Tax=Rheinheimera sp. TaxID=1869214 RepID=UPI00307E3FE0
MRQSKWVSLAAWSGAWLLISSCSTSVQQYQSTQPEFDLAAYFDGPAIAWGMVQDYNQKVTRRFCVELQGRWQQQQGTLEETFYFDDGETDQRTWRLTRLAEHQYSGEADDVIGTAVGEQQGFALQWQYQLIVTIDGEDYQFELDDWMFQLDEYRLFNRTKMKKFGLTVAEITLFFDKESPLRQCQPKAQATAGG